LILGLELLCRKSNNAENAWRALIEEVEELGGMTKSNEG
jgi:hypothetical protein